MWISVTCSSCTFIHSQVFLLHVLYTLRPDEGEFGVQEVVVIEDERNAPVSNPSASELPFPLPSASSHQNVSSSLPSQQPGTSGNATNHYEKQEENYEGMSHMDKLIAMFRGPLTLHQVLQVYHASGDSFEASIECMLEGPTLMSIVAMLKSQLDQRSCVKVNVDADDIWSDMIVCYKSPVVDFKRYIQVRVQNQPAIDTGGVRRQIYDTIFNEFVNNTHVKLFDGPPHCCRPVCTAEARSCGLFKVLGLMVAHSIAQDGVGFPYLSPTCYWYMVGGEEKAYFSP